MKQIYLSRKNLLALLAKLDKVKDGGASACTIIKYDTVNSKYPCDEIARITAVEDEEYYDRPAGIMIEDVQF